MKNFGRESETIEFKESTSENKNAWIDMCAILNKHGSGVLYYGVEDNGNIKKNGVTLGKDTLRNEATKISEHIQPTIIPTITSESYPDGDVIKVVFSGDKKPYKADGKYYIRVSDQSKEMTTDELANLVISNNYQLWEQSLSSCTIDDVDENIISSFIANGLQCNRLENKKYTKLSLLQDLDLVCNDSYHINHAGELLFSSKGPIQLDLGTWATDEKLTSIDMTVLNGNIFTLIESGMNYIKKQMNWKAKFDGNMQRIEVPEVPIEAIREIVINSYAHANYASNTYHHIDIYASTIDVYNPGSFPENLTPEDFVNTRRLSIIRNKLICNALFKCNFIEHWATGLEKAYKLCKQANVGINYRKDKDGFYISFERNDKNNPKSKFKDTFFTSSQLSESNKSLSNKEMRVLAILKENPKALINDISAKIQMSAPSIKRIIKELKDNGYIERIGNNITGSWKILK